MPDYDGHPASGGNKGGANSAFNLQEFVRMQSAGTEPSGVFRLFSVSCELA